eukprot:gnl/TRDRNA2_/TRDRNA2_94849_c0_seq1.p1 gnl/TRDRNA2_/TRDRNA2_94849_c0~~gnl/TRDRNA2_/TRDRNA2_94849_c0_seq1.p1  ORF type:complete len:444 (+),score=54.13 gnl/TRDRNA2_/TRDRNA2_94849_c0_seq1:39-1370(+)
MAGVQPTTRGQHYEDTEGALPRPWVAYQCEPPEKGRFYYYNTETAQCCWERPQILIARHCVYRDPATGGRPAFAGWKDLAPVDLAAATAAEVSERFRHFCVCLTPHGVFGRRNDGTLWRASSTEVVGLVLYPEARKLAVSYDPQGEQVSTPEGSISHAEKKVCMEILQRSLVAGTTAGAVLVAPDAHVLRRYLAKHGGKYGRPPSADIPLADALPLAKYLATFQLMPPLSCSLTGVKGLRNEAALAAHILSDEHKAYRENLKVALELLSEIRCGQLPLVAWLPTQADRYRGLLDWHDHRFQDFPMADGRVFRFDYLTGLGEITPPSNWAALKIPPPALVASDAEAGAAPGAGATSGTSRIWSASPDPGPLPDANETAGLLASVRKSLNDGALIFRGASSPESVGKVKVGESWATSADTCTRDTAQELYARYHLLGQRPARAIQ